MRARITLALLLAVTGCTKLEDVAAGSLITCETVADCPSGRVCNRSRCIFPSELGTPPDLANGKVAVTPPVGRAGTTFAVVVEATKELDGPPRVILGLDELEDLTCTPTAARTWSCPYTATGTERGGLGGYMTIDVRMVDRVGQEAVKNGVGGMELDFSPPVLAAASASPATVPLGGVIQVFFTTDEPLDGPAVLVASRPLQAGGDTRFRLEAEASTLNHLFTHLVTTSDVPGPVDFTAELVDAVGNATTAWVGSIMVDNAVPVVTNLAVAPARIDPTGVVTATFDASEAGSLTVSVGGRRMACGAFRPASPSYTCTRAMSGDEIAAGTEQGEPVVVNLIDLAGNVGSAIGNVVFDFKPPDLVRGSAVLQLTPAPGSFVPTVTALAVGGRARISFTVDEPLSGPPVITTTPELLAFSLVSEAGPFYVFEHQLAPGPHLEGPVTVQVQLTDVAGNVALRTLALPAPGLVVDTSPPTAPDVSTPSRIVYDRMPWGTSATGGAPTFQVTGAAGAVEPGATVIAKDGADVALSREIGRATAGGDGSFGPMTLVPADRREVFLLAVDGAGNVSASAGVQAARVRDVTWTASMFGKVLGSTAENPHRLEARARWLGSLEQGASNQATIPAETRGSLGWTLAASGLWVTGTAAYDSRRDRIVVPTPGYVAEWDGEVWTTIVAATAGPAGITATVYDAARGELLVYEGKCTGGTTLWAWNGTGWEARAQGASYTGWYSSHSPAPGPHRRALLTYDEARGLVILAPGPQRSAGPYVCGDVAGALDYGTYAWDGHRWTLIDAAVGYDGRMLEYDASRRVVLRRDESGAAEWDGAVWTTVTVDDPEGDGEPAFGGWTFAGDTAYDPVLGRVVLATGGSLWSWSGHSWRLEGPAPDGVMVRDTIAGSLVAFAASGLERWTGSSWALDRVPSVAPPRAIAAVYSPARHVTEAFGAAGDVYQWLTGGWQPVSTGPGGAAPVALAGAALDPATGDVVAYDAANQATWQWDGTAWTPLIPVGGVIPNLHGLATVAGVGPVGVGPNLQIIAWEGNSWLQLARGWNDREQSTTVATGDLSGVYFSLAHYFSPDYQIVSWTPGDGYQTVFYDGGQGAIYPIAPDGSGRTFVLGPSATLQLSAGSLSSANIEDPRRTGSPHQPDASGWDPDLSALVVLSGDQTWHLETEPRSRPGHLFRVAWPAGGGAGGDCFVAGGACQLESVAVAWRGVAARIENGSPSAATVSLWDGVGWVPLASPSADPGAQASASVSVTDPSVLSRLAVAPASEIDLAIVMSAATAPSPLLRTDDVSVTIRYRLP